MSPEAVLDILRNTFPDAIKHIAIEGVHPHAVVDAARWHEIALFLRDDPRLRFDWLRCIVGVDHIEDGLLTAVYELHAMHRPEWGSVAAEPLSPALRGEGRVRGIADTEMCSIAGEIAIRVRTPRDNPHIPSVVDVWPAANWHEREAFDLLGIVFDSHPDLRRILCCDDWVGHPLRKDYEFPLEYHGIPAVTEYGMTRPQH